MNPKVSVIIPTYNRAKLLPRAIKSVLSQTFKGFELIIVDDGSTDNTKEIIKEFQGRDERIKYIKYDKNKGASAARNMGIKLARGEYIAFLDSDDEWLPEKLEKQIQLFKNSKKKNLGFVGCNTLTIDEHDNKKYERKIPQCRNIFQEFLKYDPVGTGSVIAKRNVFREVGLFDENLRVSEDSDMWIRIAQKYDFDFVPELLLKCHRHEENITKILKNSRKLRDNKYLLMKHEGLYKNILKLIVLDCEELVRCVY